MSNSKTEIEMPKTLGQASRLSKERVGWNLGQKILSKKKHNHFIGYAFFQEFRIGLEIKLRRRRPKRAAHRPSLWLR